MLGSIPYGDHRSYADLNGTETPRELGRLMGANPIPIVAPCHRVARGVEIPTTFVGGHQRRQWLESHERHTRGSSETAWSLGRGMTPGSGVSG